MMYSMSHEMCAEVKTQTQIQMVLKEVFLTISQSTANIGEITVASFLSQWF